MLSCVKQERDMKNKEIFFVFKTSSTNDCDCFSGSYSCAVLFLSKTTLNAVIRIIVPIQDGPMHLWIELQYCLTFGLVKKLS